MDSLHYEETNASGKKLVCDGIQTEAGVLENQSCTSMQYKLSKNVFKQKPVIKELNSLTKFAQSQIKQTQLVKKNKAETNAILQAVAALDVRINLDFKSFQTKTHEARSKVSIETKENPFQKSYSVKGEGEGFSHTFAEGSTKLAYEAAVKDLKKQIVELILEKENELSGKPSQKIVNGERENNKSDLSSGSEVRSASKSAKSSKQ